MVIVTERKRATAGFVISLIAAILILINAIIIAFASAILGAVGLATLVNILEFAGGLLIAYAIIGMIFAILVLIGAVLIYIPGKEVVGGILVIIFSILSIITGGGFLIGLILGIVGGALGLAKK
ncbi:MAG: hypothetical protein QXH91_06960 [Candidatus Bathyarchaeia archaeon]